jgi:hypothetical protein
MRGVDYLIENELDYAAEEHGATFASMHEGAAVLFDEVQEAQDEDGSIDNLIPLFWEVIKNDDSKRARMFAEDIASHAERLACEAIQVAAMALKFVDTVEEAEK